MREKVVLITGANGEVGQGLIHALSAMPNPPTIVVLDIRDIDKEIRKKVNRVIVGDILDTDLLETLLNEYEIDTIYHLAALLSTHSEFHPESAHRVNVQGTVNLLKLAVEQGASRGEAVKFMFPSSIAVYGIPDLATKDQAEAVGEDDFLNPTTMYGCNKLYCEHLGRYYTHHYQQLSAKQSDGVDFRCVRFPGLISAMTIPAGGTSDYAPEMLHYAVQGKPYASFVREDTMIPFMVMPDAIDALLKLWQAPQSDLSREVYNVTSFSYSAEEFADIVRGYFPSADISFEPTVKRQAIVDTWPRILDDSRARDDWGWQPQYDGKRAFEDYLVPKIRQQYDNSP